MKNSGKALSSLKTNEIEMGWKKEPKKIYTTESIIQPFQSIFLTLDVLWRFNFIVFLYCELLFRGLKFYEQLRRENLWGFWVKFILSKTMEALHSKSWSTFRKVKKFEEFQPLNKFTIIILGSIAVSIVKCSAILFGSRHL